LFVDATGYYRQAAFQQQILQEVQTGFAHLQAAVAAYKSPPDGATITRAVTGFLPGGNQKYFREFRLLLLSVGVMRQFQRPSVRTDVVVFTDASSIGSLAAIGCTTNLRRAKSDEERCIVVVHESLKSRARDDPLDDYPNADSVEFIVRLPNPEMYDFILRGDLDTFLTPGFANWIPERSAVLYVGHGGYGSREAVARLRWIAQELNLPYNKMHNVGSTWYGATQVMIALSDFSTSLMRYLATNAFTEYERCCNGVDGWPRWHRPVISMYSGDLAVNVLSTDQVRQHGNGFFMDFGSDQQGVMSPEIKHLHCWHTRGRFSKFVFIEGGYKDIDLTPHLAMETPADYATVIAVSAARLSDAELKNFLADADALKARKWLKVTP
jgi:hypothetical protein